MAAPRFCTSAVPAPTAAVLKALERCGLLLKQDKRLPSVVTIVTGETLSTSWWAHPKSHLIFRVLAELADHPDVLLTKLVLAKDTLVHRSLWPAFLAVAAAREPWQMAHLSTAARRLLERTLEARTPLKSSGAPVKELVSRLLVHASEVHTAAGKHQLELASWSFWAAQVDVAPLHSLARARKDLEAASRKLGAPLSALPWRATRTAGQSGRGAVRPP